jgi:hypothetical protein
MNNSANAPYPAGDPVDPATTGQIMKFTVTGDPAVAPVALPSPLNTIPVLTNDSPGRTLTLNEMQGPGGPLQMVLNGQSYASPITETPKIGSTEEWELVNMTMDTHPMHLHLVQYQVVNRQAYDSVAYGIDWTALNGIPPLSNPTITLPVTPYLTGPPLPPAANEMGWKDTVQSNPGEVTRIRVRFAPQDAIGAAPNVNKFPFDPTFGPGYVWHCHIVDHEDNEMMRPMAVLQSGKPILSLKSDDAFWASYADYTARKLSVPYSITNGAGGTANTIQVTGTINTMGVTLDTPLPYLAGDLAAASSLDLTLKYNVPVGVSYFRTTLNVSAEDTTGASYTYP